MKEIYLEGSVGFSFWGEPAFTAAEVRNMIGGERAPLTVNLNSGGGLASEGVAIYNLLKAHPAEVHVVINGMAASAASMIAMAGDTITMLAGSQIMIHDPATEYSGGRGTADDHQRKADELERMSQQWAQIYADRAGITVEEAREIMRVETYYTPEEAVAAGFATATDEEQAQEVAVFDYQIYAHAPQELLTAGRADSPSKMAVLAMICGLEAPNAQESTMENDQLEDQVTTAEAAEEEEEGDDQVTASTEEDPTAEEEQVEAAEDPDDMTTAIMDLVHMHGDGIDVARGFISRKATLASVVAHYKSKGKPLAHVNPNAPRARIIRDEADTRRQYMPVALAAQITRKPKVAAGAQPYMTMTIAQMMAACANYTGPLRSAGDIDRMIRAAAHTTSDFPAILENTMNKVLLERYQMAQPTYQAVSRRRDFRDFRPAPLVRSGDFPMPKLLGEGGAIKYGTIGEGKETAQLFTYASGLRITRQTIVNDDLGALDDAMRDYGSVISRMEETVFYSALLSAALSDGKAIFHADHGNLAGTAAAINKASLSIARSSIRKQKGLDGGSLNLAPAILLVGPDKETEAESIVADITATKVEEFNPFSRKLQVIVTNEITGNAWYVLADPNAAGGEIWTHGFLDGNAAPIVRTENTFGTDGMAMEIIHDFGFGAVDYRGGFKNAGA
jgi:ATP-dependent protease ClpP protease subunit